MAAPDRPDDPRGDNSTPEPDDADLAKLFGDAVNSSGMAGDGQWEPPEVEDMIDWFPGFEIKSLLGRGGMGAVYRAKQISLRRDVAIKILPEVFGRDQQFAERFQREAWAMARLSHHNIVSVYDCGKTTGGHHYLVMELINGTDLHKYIYSNDLNVEESINFVKQICDALEYAHKNNFVHRDIKPANIFVNREGVIKVGDFGLAKLVNPGDDTGLYLPLTRTGVALYTPHFSPPEQYTGASIDHRADIFSLGVTFYQMLTREIPYGAFLMPSEKDAIDEWIDGVVIKAMQPNPELRYQTVRELREALEPVVPPPPPPPPPAEGTVLIEAGAFTKGANLSVVEQLQTRAPRNLSLDNYKRPEPCRIHLDAFKIGVTPVTNEAYHEFVREMNWSTPMDWHGTSFPPGKGDFPVTNITETDARLYCEWRGGRLPDPDEWEKAARGPNEFAYPWGNRFDPSCCASSESGARELSPVTTFENGKSSYGLIDLVGNAGEMVNGGENDAVLVRGGCWSDECRYYGLSWATSWESDRNKTNPTIGFRFAAGAGDDFHPDFSAIDTNMHSPVIETAGMRATIGCSAQLLTEVSHRYGKWISNDVIERLRREHPERDITLPPLKVAKYPVTNIEFYQFIRESGFRLDEEPGYWISDFRLISALQKIRAERDGPWKAVGCESAPWFWPDAFKPVCGVSRRAMREYTSWLSRKTGRSWRLPTDTEWEALARGHDARWYPWGNHYTNGLCNSAEYGMERPVEVWRFAEGDSPTGLRQMAGNVFEWVEVENGPASMAVCGGAYGATAEVYGLNFFRIFIGQGIESKKNAGFRLVYL